MKNSRVDIRGIRQEQIVEAAVAVIAEQGLPNLSLSEIEKKTGMSRGQLTYYFPAKEDILLAVFDRLLQLTYQRIGTSEKMGEAGAGGGYELVRHLLERLVGQAALRSDFHSLQYTFLAQIGHREDFRQRLASLYEEWRGGMAQRLAEDMPRTPGTCSPRALATLIQAILHGLAMQTAADPNAFDRDEMLQLCLEIVVGYLDGSRLASRNGKHP